LSISVLIVEDHPVVRAGILRILLRAPDISVVGETGDGFEALRLVAELSPEIMLLDINIQGLDGNEVARRLKDSKSSTHVLALSAYTEIAFIRGMLENGAAGYLIKDELPETILEAIRGIARGERGWFSRQVMAQLSSSMQEKQERKPSDILSKRELEILQGVVRGKINKDIARSLGVREKTVEKHLDAIFTKLGVGTRVEAAVFATRRGWFPPTA
jgi:DNA-binding NarL/FixJ family response regulator